MVIFVTCCWCRVFLEILMWLLDEQYILLARNVHDKFISHNAWRTKRWTYLHLRVANRYIKSHKTNWQEILHQMIIMQPPQQKRISRLQRSWCKSSSLIAKSSSKLLVVLPNIPIWSHIFLSVSPKSSSEIDQVTSLLAFVNCTNMQIILNDL